MRGDNLIRDLVLIWLMFGLLFAANAFIFSR